MVAIRVWNKCNNNCIMCSNYSIRESEEDRDISKLLSRIKEKEPNPKEITFTGGEPFLNPEIFNLIKKFRDLYPNAEINILTNGRVFFYPKYCSKIKECLDDNMKLAISILGPTSEVHDSVTLSPGSFHQTMEGIKKLIKLNVKIELRVIVLKQNHNYLKEIAKYISENLKEINYIVFVFVDIISNALKNEKKVAITYKETIPHLIKAMEQLNKNNIKFRLYHFPLCILPPKFWDTSWISVEEKKIKKLEKCSKCPYSKFCVGILKGYHSILGGEEFEPPKNITVIPNHNPYNPIKEIKND